MNKHLFFVIVFLCPFLVFSQNVGVGTPAPLMKLHVSHTDSVVLLLENTQPLNTNVSTSLYFKTGNGSYQYTGALKTIGTGTNAARLGLFTWASSTPNGLLERMSITDDGKIGIGTTVPSSRLTVVGTFGDPAIPGTASTGVLRVGVGSNNNNGIDFGKSGTSPFSGWMQAGAFGNTTNPLSLQPLGGNVGIGLLSPSAKLEVEGGIKADSLDVQSGLIKNVADPISAQDAATKAYVDASTSSPTYTIGLSAEQGGYIFWVSADGKHGLVAETVDQSSSSNWYNAQDIISNPSNHSADGDDFRDWRMPTKYELNEMYLQKDSIGGFSSDFYWSSTEFDNNDAWVQDGGSGFLLNVIKGYNGYVRAVRAF